jgi:hypothetical protein
MRRYLQKLCLTPQVLGLYLVLLELRTQLLHKTPNALQLCMCRT